MNEIILTTTNKHCISWNFFLQDGNLDLIGKMSMLIISVFELSYVVVTFRSLKLLETMLSPVYPMLSSALSSSLGM